MARTKATLGDGIRLSDYAPLQALAQKACVALANPKEQPHAFYAGLRLVAMDGSNFEIPDETANADEFGRPGSRTGRTAYPQAQCAVLVECAIHAILGAYRTAPWEVCKPLLSHLGPDMLCLTDRGFTGYERWKAASAGVAQARYRLLSTMLDPVQAPAVDLATLYHARWEVESVFDELKTHPAQNRRTLRSKTPDGVRQEFFGWVLAHYAVCWLMHQTASEHKLAQRRLSFTGHVQLMRCSQPRSGAFPPERPTLRKRWFKNLLQEASTLRCTSSKGRCNPRMVKRRHSPYASHDPSKLPDKHLDYSPALLGPMPLSPNTKFAITC